MPKFNGTLVPNMEGYTRESNSGFMIKQKVADFLVYGVLEDWNDPDSFRPLDEEERETVSLRGFQISDEDFPPPTMKSAMKR